MTYNGKHNKILFFVFQKININHAFLEKKDILALVLEVFAENPKKSRRNL